VLPCPHCFAEPDADVLHHGVLHMVARVGEAIRAAGAGYGSDSVLSAARTVSGMQVKFRRNRADFPMLGMKQVTDLSDLFIGNHVSPREKDSPSVPGAHSSDRRPRSPRARRPTQDKNLPPQGLGSALEPEAPSGSHRGKYEGKIDPSRGLASDGGKHPGDPDDRDALPHSVGGGGWLRGAVGDGIYHGSGNCNNAGHDHSEGRDKTPHYREESDTRAGERRRNKQPAPVSRGTGQPATIMAG
jgi:hypothetical protein